MNTAAARRVRLTAAPERPCRHVRDLPLNPTIAYDAISIGSLLP